MVSAAVQFTSTTWCSANAWRRDVRTAPVLASRQLDMESTRVIVEGAETLKLLELTAAGGNARQAAYALSMLSQARAARGDAYPCR